MVTLLFHNITVSAMFTSNNSIQLTNIIIERDLTTNISIRKSKDYVYGIWVYKVLGIWKGYYRLKMTCFMHETVNRGKK